MDTGHPKEGPPVVLLLNVATSNKSSKQFRFCDKKEVRKTVLSQKVNVSTKKRRKNQSYFMLRSSIKLFSLLGFVSSNLTKRGVLRKILVKIFYS